MNIIELYLILCLLFGFIFNTDLTNSIQNRIEETENDKKRLPNGSYVSNDLVFAISYIICTLIWPFTLIEIVSNKYKK